MIILVIGSGGREHALAWKLAQSPLVQQIYVAPGNAGTEWPSAPGKAPSANVAIQPDDVAALLDFARRNAIHLTVVGPEAPLAAGIVDSFDQAGLKIFGPTQAAAQLESSKAFAKDFMQRHAIPTAQHQSFDSFDDAATFVRSSGKALVVKADGLAAGKGVIVCDTVDEALAAVQRILLDGEFGSAGRQVVIEERLSGPEISVLAFCDGQDALIMPPARDHKRIYDGDQGPNTGGMGAICLGDRDNSLISDALLREINTRVVLPTLRGMAEEGRPYRGVLYVGLMLTQDGAGINVLEFNARFGDPETQVILPLLKGDLVEIMLACVDGNLRSYLDRHPNGSIWENAACAAVVLAAPGYPGDYRKGLPIGGLEDVKAAQVFLAGTARDSQNRFVTSGGRVLAVSARGATLSQALDRAYGDVGLIHFDGMQFRRDIGQTSILETRS